MGEGKGCSRSLVGGGVGGAWCSRGRAEVQALQRDNLEGAFNGFILAHVQGLDELPDLVLAAPILSLPPGKLLTLLSEVGVLVQRLLVHMTAQHLRLISG